MIAALEFADYAVIALVVFLFAGGPAAWLGFKPSEVQRLFRMERKIDLILEHLGIEYANPATAAGLSDDVRKLADKPATKLHAIKLHRKQTGVGLKDAKEAVEDYMKSQD